MFEFKLLSYSFFIELILISIFYYFFIKNNKKDKESVKEMFNRLKSKINKVIIEHFFIIRVYLGYKIILSLLLTNFIVTILLIIVSLDTYSFITDDLLSQKDMLLKLLKNA